MLEQPPGEWWRIEGGCGWGPNAYYDSNSSSESLIDYLKRQTIKYIIRNHLNPHAPVAKFGHTQLTNREQQQQLET